MLVPPLLAQLMQLRSLFVFDESTHGRSNDSAQLVIERRHCREALAYLGEPVERPTPAPRRRYPTATLREHRTEMNAHGEATILGSPVMTMAAALVFLSAFYVVDLACACLKQWSFKP